MEPSFDGKISRYQCNFRKGHNSQHCLMTVIEKWREIVDNGEAFNVLLANLSKARSNRSLVFYIKDTLKAFDDFKHRQQKCMK